MKVKKMIALKKFLGAMFEKILMQQKNLETQVGFSNLLDDVNQAINRKTQIDKEGIQQIDQMVKSIEANNKWVKEQFERITTQPGFMRIPTPQAPEEGKKLKKKSNLSVTQPEAGLKRKSTVKLDESKEAQDH